MVVTIALAIFATAQPQLARAQEAPFGLVDWEPIAGKPVLAGTGTNTWDRKTRERGYILMGDDGIFHLWYTGYDRDRPDTMSLGHATSRDGTHWTRDPHNPIFTGSWVEDMCVVKQDGTYQMFAEGKNDIAHRLSSGDGVHWTEHGSLDIRKTDGTPIDPGPYGTPMAWFENGTWYEWHSVKLNTLSFKVLRRKTPAHRQIIDNMISISLDHKSRVSEAYSIFHIRTFSDLC